MLAHLTIAGHHRQHCSIKVGQSQNHKAVHVHLPQPAQACMQEGSPHLSHATEEFSLWVFRSALHTNVSEQCLHLSSFSFWVWSTCSLVVFLAFTTSTVGCFTAAGFSASGAAGVGSGSPNSSTGTPGGGSELQSSPGRAGEDRKFFFRNSSLLFKFLFSLAWYGVLVDYFTYSDNRAIEP